MSSKRYPEEFKIETVKQITERGHPVTEVVSRIGSIANWQSTPCWWPCHGENRDSVDRSFRSGESIQQAWLAGFPQSPWPDWQHEPPEKLLRQCSGREFLPTAKTGANPPQDRDREEARRDVFNYIEMFYNEKRRHGYANSVSPVEFENQYFNRLQSVY